MKFKKYILLCLSLLCLVSCNWYYYYDSLEEYIKNVENDGIAHSAYELDLAETLLPSRTFLTDFKYSFGEYHFYERDLFNYKKNEADVVIINLTYESSTYIEAKEFADSHLDLSPVHTYEYNNYYFAENMAHPKHYGDGKYSHIDENGNNKFFLNWFTMYGYNDDKNTLIFMGFNGYLDDEEKERCLNDWGYFLNKYYGKYYDFNS